ncbi:hypothetical protein BHWA1_00507 [Brachyspira hyodysenteriae WA1]|uniref:Uncharacterized protein n=1 Tax=Brachyspira hyodysenteriae (strain ATCC 49526 / WA1) TaxID=565034 RepID=A0A3B6VB41_BRAHW|nr:hypothetical protein BHWA1_00507 [Brachyspira hyodysenteriae WA1]
MFNTPNINMGLLRSTINIYKPKENIENHFIDRIIKINDLKNQCYL